MLLPSALPCDLAQPLRPTRRSDGYFSPPSSPPTISSAAALSNIMTTCRSLQSLIATPAPSAFLLPTVARPLLPQLPTPPMAHAVLPMKLRLRVRDNPASDDLYNRRRIAKRSELLQPSSANRSVNKRRRCAEEDHVGPEDVSPEDASEVDDGNDEMSQPSEKVSEQSDSVAPSTPKRARIAPEVLPLGLDRSDFHDVHREAGQDINSASQGTNIEIEPDGQDWSAEDDRILVELVLEKLKLTKSEWQDCARNLGKDRQGVSRRWKSLMMKGEIGLKTRSSSRRDCLHSTWR